MSKRGRGRPSKS